MHRFLLLSAVSTLVAFGQDSLPEGPGKAMVMEVCTTCHDIEAALSVRRTKSVWEDTVNDMVSRGAKATDEEVVRIVAYLTTHFGKININTASLRVLEDSLGFTEAEARAVLDYRAENGNVKNFEQLKQVPGISAAKVDQKKALIAFTS